VPDGDHVAWGEPFRHCEGVRLARDGMGIHTAELLRLAD
jgi:hypothetical protein